VRAEDHPPAELLAGALSGTGSEDEPQDVEIQASVTADEVRALETPRTSLRLVGAAQAGREDFSRRQNLPGQLEPGVEYREVRMHRRIAGRVAEPGEDR
jgi:hypothetical protein